MKPLFSISMGYESLFDDYKSVDPVKLISDIPSKNALEIIGYFIAQIHGKERDVENQIEFLNIWCSRFPQEITPKIQEYINRTMKSGVSEFNFINNNGALILIEILLENHNELEPVKNITPLQELNLFKAYIWCNQQWTDKQLGLMPEKMESVNDFITLILPAQLPYFETTTLKDFKPQFLKAIFFFKYCEQDDAFRIFLKAFVDDYSLDNWQGYLRNILSLYIRRYKDLQIPSIIEIPDKFADVINFINNFCLDINDYQKSDDFKFLRINPIYKIEDNRFLFLNLNFFVDKLFQGIQFDFFRVLKDNNIKYNGKGIKSFDTYKSIYAERISENGLFYEILKYCFVNSNYTLKSGEEMKQILKEGEPDFYIRDKNKIFLFEYKDVLLNAKTKHSYDYESIRKEISKKFIANEKGSQKGISQLLNSIDSIRSGNFKSIDEELNHKDCIIYPIIVFTDYSFNHPGINFILNQEFEIALQARNIPNKHKVKNVTMIDLDDFLKYQDLFRSNKLKLTKCLDNYRSQINNKGLYDPILPFTKSIENMALREGISISEMLLNEVGDMINEN